MPRLPIWLPLALLLCACPTEEERSTVYGGGELSVGFVTTGGGPNGAQSAPGPVQALLVHPDDFVCAGDAKAQLAVSARGDGVESLAVNACIPGAELGSFLPCGLSNPVLVELSLFLFDPALADAEDLPLDRAERQGITFELRSGGQTARVTTPYSGSITLSSPTDGTVDWVDLSWGCDDGTTEPWQSSAGVQWNFDGGVSRQAGPLAEAPQS